MADIKQIQVGDTKYNISGAAIVLEDNNTTVNGTWLAKTNQINSLEDGQIFLYKLTTTPGSTTTSLNITGSAGTALGAKTVYRYGTTKLAGTTATYGVGHYILLTYNSTNDCFRLMNDYDANTDNYTVRQYQFGDNAAGTGTNYPILTRYNLTNKNNSYDTAYSRFYNKTYIDTSNGYLYAPKLFSGDSEVALKTDIPTVNNATLTIQKNGTTVETFTANASSNVTANITVPTKTSDLTNDSSFITGITSSDVTTALGYTPVDSSSLATVATTGAYSDLTGAPTIPDTFIDITNGLTEAIKTKVIANPAIILKKGNYHYVPNYKGSGDVAPMIYSCFEGDVDDGNFRYLSINWTGLTVTESTNCYAQYTLYKDLDLNSYDLNNIGGIYNANSNFAIDSDGCLEYSNSNPMYIHESHKTNNVSHDLILKTDQQEARTKDTEYTFKEDGIYKDAVKMPSKYTFDYGTCSTAASTAAKTVSTENNLVVANGVTVCVNFSNKNTKANATLSVNNSTAATIRYRGSALTSTTARLLYGYVLLQYQGQYWDIISYTAEDLESIATCSTASATAAKGAVTIPGIKEVVTGVRATVKFTNTNTAANPTININSSGNKSIYFNGAAITADLAEVLNGWVELMFNGTQWEVVNKDKYTTWTIVNADGTTSTAKILIL